MQANSYDVIIVGGGITGLAFACMLAQKTSLSIAILESQLSNHDWSEKKYHHRVSAIALSSQRIFQNLNVWKEICEKRISAFTQIQVWDAQSQGEISFDSKEIAEPELGYIIENNLMQSVLTSTIKKNYHQVKIISPIKLINMIETENHIELMTDTKEIYCGKLIVGADGANSWVCKEANISLEKSSYQQEAIVATVQTDLPHHAIARQIFLPTGPLAFLPLSHEKHSSIVWSLPSDDAKKLKNIEMTEFQNKLGHAFEYRLGDIEKVEERFSFPLFKQHAQAYVKSRIALIGDAAHTVHPLAGQGVNMGLLDAASLVDVIVDAIHQHRDMSSYASLRRYERWRKADNAIMQVGVDAIKCLFASEKKSIQTLRSVGVNAANRMPWIKNQFTKHAVGDREGLPMYAQINPSSVL